MTEAEFEAKLAEWFDASRSHDPFGLVVDTTAELHVPNTGTVPGIIVVLEDGSEFLVVARKVAT